MNDITSEYLKCSIDYIYFIENYLTTYDQTQGGNVPFKLFPIQQNILHNFKKSRYNLALKYRQAGLSTITAAYVCWLLLFADEESPEKVLIVANKRDTAALMLKKVNEFINQCPDWMFDVDKDDMYAKSTEFHKVLYNKSEVKAVATSMDALRGYTPTLMIIDEAAHIDNIDVEEFWTASMAALSCVHEDTYVFTDNGLIRLKNIIDEKENEGFTPYNGRLKVINKDLEIVDIKSTFKSIKSECYKIKTKSGVELIGSFKHPIMINNGVNDEWVRMKHLNVGHKLKIQYNQQLFGEDINIDFKVKHGNEKEKYVLPKKLKDDLNLSYLIGLFIADGNYTKRGLSITNGDIETQEFLLGVGFKKHSKRHYTFSSTHLKRFFNNFIGIENNSAKDKKIPELIMRSSKETIIAFLQGMFDGDGCAFSNGVKYSSTSKILVEQLQILLLNFGIRSYIRYSEQKISNTSIVKNKNTVTKTYNLFIKNEFIVDFFEKIGFRLSRKQNKKEFFINRIKNSSFIYATKDELKKILSENSIKRNQYDKEYRFLDKLMRYDKKKLSYHGYLKLIDKKLENQKTLKKWVKRYSEQKNYFYDEIISVEKYDDYTYDLEIPKGRSFITNGIISHNTGGRTILISTPNGNDMIYWKTYNNAKLGKNKFVINEIKWYQDPRYNVGLTWKKDDEEIENWNQDEWKELVKNGWKPSSPWYEGMKADMDSPRKVSQEIDGNFVGSGNTFVSGEDIDIQERENICDPIRVEGFDKSVWVFKEPEKGHRYAAGLDISLGQSDDWSVLSIVDYDTWEQVFEWRGKMAPDVVAEFILKYLDMYGNPMLITDLTGGLGLITVNKLKEFGYKNFFYDYKGKDMYGYVNKDELAAGLVIGSSIVRMNVLDSFERNVRQGFKVRSHRVLSEMRTFIVNASGKPDHMKGCNDDCLFSLALALYLCEVRFKELTKNESQIKSLLSSWTIESTDTGVPTYNMQDIMNPLGKQMDQKQMQTQYGWLFGTKK